VEYQSTIREARDLAALRLGQDVFAIVTKGTPPDWKGCAALKPKIAGLERWFVGCVAGNDDAITGLESGSDFQCPWNNSLLLRKPAIAL
jgi:hypothetical protein